MRVLSLIVVAGLLGACSDLGAQRRNFLASMVGQPETELIRQLGVPTRSYDTDGRRFLAYEDRRLDIVPGPFFGAGFGFGYWGRSGGFYSAGFPSEVVESGCDTTFEVAGGVVRSWSLRGNRCG